MCACCALEQRDDRSVVGALDVALHVLRGERLHERLDLLGELVALLDRDHVHVCVRRIALGALDSQGVGHIQASLERIVAIDGGKVDVLQHAGELRCLHFLDVQVLRVLDDVLLGGGEASALIQLDAALLLEQQQRTRLVGGVVRHSDGSAVSQRIQGGRLARIQAKGLEVDACCVHQVRAVLLIEVVQVRDVLEVVRVQLVVLERGVRQDVVVVFDDIQLIALLRESILRLAQDLSVRRGGCADADDLVGISS